MSVWDEISRGLNPVGTLAGRVGARASANPYVRAGFIGARNALIPGFRGRTSPKSDSGSFGDVIQRFESGVRGLAERAAENYRNQQQPPPPDPLGELYNSLIQQLQGPISVDEADLMSQIRGQFDPVFDARRAALQQMMTEATGRSRTGREEVVGQYESLAQDYERLAPEQLAQAEEQKAATEQLYGQLRSNVEGNYSRIQQEQGELFEQLGIEEAAPEVLAPQGEDAAQAMTRADILGTLAQQRQADIGALEADYYRSGAPVARLTGTNRSQQMLADLESYLRGRESDIGVLEAERTSGVQTAYTQLLQQAQQQAQQQEQFQTQSLMDIMMGQMQAQIQQTEAPDLSNPQTFLQNLPGSQGNQVLNAYQQIQQSPELIEGRQISQLNPTPGTLIPATTQLQMQMAEQLLAEGAIDNTTFQALLHFITLNEGKAFAPSPFG